MSAYRRLLQALRRSRVGAPPDALLERVMAAARAGDPGDAPYDPEQALSFPFNQHNYDVNLRFCFDFTVAIEALGVRPGQTVLDFASGFGWSTELLNRFGFATVTFDISRELLTVGRSRLQLDRRCNPERVHAVAGSGWALPFSDASVDGILCLNALHHMPDFEPVFREMWRVLRPGGRAAFSEPGVGHSADPTARMCMEQHGMLERDVIATDVYRLAMRAGFARMVLKPYRYPVQVDLEYRNDGSGWRRRLRTARAAWTFARDAEMSHMLFYLEKGGGARSRRAPVLAAALDVSETPRHTPAGSVLNVTARCHNRGDTVWSAAPTLSSPQITFGVKVLSPHGALLDDRRGRTALAHDVGPGAHIDIAAAVPLDGLPRGAYRLLFDMVCEQVTWFQGVGSQPVERALEVM